VLIIIAANNLFFLFLHFSHIAKKKKGPAKNNDLRKENYLNMAKIFIKKSVLLKKEYNCDCEYGKRRRKLLYTHIGWLKNTSKITQMLLGS